MAPLNQVALPIGALAGVSTSIYYPYNVICQQSGISFGIEANCQVIQIGVREVTAAVLTCLELLQRKQHKGLRRSLDPVSVLSQIYQQNQKY